jgi:hypothetical protein
MTVKEVLKEYYHIDKPVKVWYGNLMLAYLDIDSLEGCPEIVIGNCNLCGNYLHDLKGGPKEVTGYFACNNNLKSLKGCPKYVGDDFCCIGNYTEFTEEQVRTLCNVKGDVHVR